MDVLVIGGGAAGMMAAYAAAEQGARVTLAERNEKLGKKLYITGKGRCNLTNACPTEEFFDHVLSNPKFLYSSIYSFDQDAVCRFLESEGLVLKEERGKRVFPRSDKSSDVIKTLEQALRKRQVKILLHTRISALHIRDGIFEKADLVGGGSLRADSVIIATGGLSYPSTGSDGDGYRFAEELGHQIIKPEPSLVGLRVKEPFVKELEGLSLRNISLKAPGFQEFGEMLFTADGISGPAVLSMSAVLCRKIALGEELTVSVDLKPALSAEQLDARVQRDFSEVKNKVFKNALDKLLPAKLIPVIVSRSEIPGDKKVNEVTRAERARLVSLLKDFSCTVVGTQGFSQAVITRGGVNVKEINPGTMQSRKVRNVFFAGEVMDVDAFTGGFNLQIAWSTGYLAGCSAAEYRQSFDR